MESKAYQIEYEQEGDSWWAYIPELPGCVAVGKSKAEVEKLIQEALDLHLECILEHWEI